LAPTIVTILVFVDVVAQVDNIINAILTNDVAIGIEETEGIVGARVYCKADFGNIVICVWCSLRAAERTLVVGATNVELIIISGVGTQFLSLDLLFG
jgi:hypothetical protein